MNKIFKSSIAWTVMIVSLFGLSACNKEFDNPPTYEAPNITANTTIRDLKAMHTASGTAQEITTDIIIRGIVVGDDRTGNLYKSIVLQDETGGILIRLDGTNLYTSYPEGREIFIKCKGLFIGDYNRLIQLGGSVDNSGPSASVLPVASALFTDYIVVGSTGNTVTPKVVTLNQLTTNMQDSFQNTLIQLENFEFHVNDTLNTFGDPTLTNSALNYTIRDCSNGSITLRNSSYASFSADRLPGGNGSITAIFSTFGNTRQLTIRDVTDVQFTGARCNAGGGGTPGGGEAPNPNRITVAALRNMLPGTTDVNVPANTHFTAKVISNSSNEANGNYRLQDESGAGILLYTMQGSPVYPIGTVINVNATGGVLTSFNGEKELKSVPISNITISTLDIPITPVVRTAAEIIANRSNWSSSLVKINNLTSIVTGTSNATGTNYTITDATGSLKMFVRNASGINVNTSGNTITGYVSIFNTDTQIGIRSAGDIQ